MQGWKKVEARRHSSHAGNDQAAQCHQVDHQLRNHNATSRKTDLFREISLRFEL